MANRRIFRIHPAIGIARVGDAGADHFFIGPESPGLPPDGSPPGTSTANLKEAGKVKPQAARFRVYEYRRTGSRIELVREVTLSEADVDRIEWTVHVANRKASFHEFDGEKGEATAPAAKRNSGVPSADRAKKLEIDPQPRAIHGKDKKFSAGTPATHSYRFTPGTSVDPSKETWPVDSGGAEVINYLGEIRTDDEGRLIVIGGRGAAKSSTSPVPVLSDYANNDSWFDDVSDGPVTAKIVLRVKGKLRTFRAKNTNGAWVMVGTPDYAPGIGNIVTLYDLLFDMAVRKLKIPKGNKVFDGPLKHLKKLNRELKILSRKKLRSYQPSFDSDIYPILRRALDVRWVFAPARMIHVSISGDTSIDGLPSFWEYLGDPAKPGSESLRSAFFRRLRKPEGMPASPDRDMPQLLGDMPYTAGHERFRLALPHTQHAMLERWKGGKFIKAVGPIPPTPPPRVITPEGLDKAALENCVGGAFYPGIEVSWQIRNPKLFGEPFRLNLKARSRYKGETGRITAGHFTRQLAVPWQADFTECKTELTGGTPFGWWPAQRPSDALPQLMGPPPALGRDDSDMRPWFRNDGGAVLRDKESMVRHWSKLGFVVQRGSEFAERERGSIP